MALKDQLERSTKSPPPPAEPFVAAVAATNPVHSSGLDFFNRLGEFVQLSEHQRDVHLANTVQTLSMYGFPPLFGADGVNRAREGSNQVVTRLTGLSYFIHGGAAGQSALPEHRMALVAAASEMYMDASLIHDDLMDRSDTRRGRLSLHRHFEQVHQESGWVGDAYRMGTSLALMIGDALMVASDNVFREGLQKLPRSVHGEQVEYMVRLHELTRIEQLMGQSMDTVLPYLPDMDDPEKIIQGALDTIKTKSARYLAGTPLAMGAAGAGAGRQAADIMMRVGLILGEAYQLKDDLIGALGDPETSGKPVGQDLIEGKRTVLVGLTLRLLGPKQRKAFVGALLRGDAPPVEARVRHLQDVIRSSGAVELLETMIDDRRRRAFAALQDAHLDDEARAAVRETADWFLAPAHT
ncbi:MAG: polyprenyl synthetase family protein [Bifidobacteriaceae bacterium]|nr:polyprenyl synthetase family protein [Bifidobacteriaceae bacterium]